MELWSLLDDPADVLGVCFDPANLAAMHYDPICFIEDVERELGIAPAIVHVKDVERTTRAGATGPGWTAYGPQPPIRFRAVPWGELDWRRIVTALVDVQFSGPFVVEHEDLLVGREDGIAGAVAHLRPLMRLRTGEARWW